MTMRDNETSRFRNIEWRVNFQKKPDGILFDTGASAYDISNETSKTKVIMLCVTDDDVAQKRPKR